MHKNCARTNEQMKKEYLDEQQVQLRNVALGDYFMLSAPNHCEQADERKVYIRGEYDRTSKRYSVTKYTDYCAERFLRGDRLVWVGFCF